MGTRQVERVFEERQSNGRTFQKLILGEYEWLDYLDINGLISNVLNGMLSLNIKKGQHVVIYSETRMEWMVTAIACFKGGFPSKFFFYFKKIDIKYLDLCQDLNEING